MTLTLTLWVAHFHRSFQDVLLNISVCWIGESCCTQGTTCQHQILSKEWCICQAEFVKLYRLRVKQCSKRNFPVLKNNHRFNHKPKFTVQHGRTNPKVFHLQNNAKECYFVRGEIMIERFLLEGTMYLLIVPGSTEKNEVCGQQVRSVGNVRISGTHRPEAFRWKKWSNQRWIFRDFATDWQW